MKEKLRDAIEVKWKCFSLEQSHSSRGPDFKLWEHPDVPSRSLMAMQAAKCAQLQGNDLFDTFHLLLFEAFHVEKKNVDREGDLKRIAQEAHMNIPKFLEDLRSDSSRQWVGHDHMEGVEKYRVFGIPTLVLNQGNPFFIKVGSLPDSQDRKVHLFKEIQELITHQPHVLEIKRT